MMSRTDAVEALAKRQGVEAPNEGTKAWLAMLVEALELQLEQEAAAREGLSQQLGHLEAAVADATERIAFLEAQPQEGDDGGADHPQAPPSPTGDAFVAFTSVRQVPGAVLGPGLYMRNPSYQVLQQASWVWCSAEDYAKAERRLVCLPDGRIAEEE